MATYIFVRVIVVAIVAFVACACTLPGDEPLTTLRFEFSPGHASGSVVLLRGRGGGPDTFAQQGWIEAAWDRGESWSLVVPDTHFGYYREATLVKRLRSEVIAALTNHEPQGKVWLVGVSMGGLGSLYYLLQHPDDVAGVVLIAPYLGSEKLASEISSSGGLDTWQAGGTLDDDWEREFWTELQAFLRRQDTPPIYLAYGFDDRFVVSQNVLADALPEDKVLKMKGGHRNGVFKALWLEILDRGVINFLSW